MPTTCAADVLIGALRAEGCTNAVHRSTDPGYSAVYVELDGHGVLIIADMECCAHHEVADHIHPWWVRYQTDPGDPSPYHVVYEGVEGESFAADTDACVGAVVSFLRRHSTLPGPRCDTSTARTAGDGDV